MLTNSSLTIYHKIFDNDTRDIKWIRYNYDKVWFFGGKGASINKGYVDGNDVQIRIPYETPLLDINNFSIGDIIVQGTIEDNIDAQEDLSSYLTYNITSINDNNFGIRHIHLGGK
jgi:hypothetical protein